MIFGSHMEEIAFHARMGDLDKINAVLDVKQMQGSVAILTGRARARRVLGIEPKLPDLAAPMNLREEFAESRY
jgi:hypothetical protein